METDRRRRSSESGGGRAVWIGRAISVVLAALTGAAFGPLATLAAAATADEGGWNPARLNPRTGASMAWDVGRERLVLFGGRSPGVGIQGVTWEWDGSQWLRVSREGPHSRFEQAMAYDSRRGKTVLFGGRRETDLPLGDTWEWDGVAWDRLDAPGPPPRWGHSMVYDEGRGRLVLFGGVTMEGSNSRVVNDTWEFDGVAWRLVSSSGPEARRSAAMAYDPTRHRVVLFGGQNLSMYGAYLEDTWEWDGTRWENVTTWPSPPARERGAMAFDKARGTVALFGGRQYLGQRADLWSWDGATWTKLDEFGGPQPRADHAMACDPVRNQVLVYGGQRGTDILGDMYGWNGSKWTRLHYDEYRGFSGVRMAYDVAQGKMMRIGGGKLENRILTSSFAAIFWNGGDWDMILPYWGTEQPSRIIMDHGLVYDDKRERLVLYGGGGYPYSSTGQTVYGDTWEWIGPNWLRILGPAPPARRFLGMAYDKAREKTLLFGGENGRFPMDDTWTYDETGWTCLSPGGVETQYGATAATRSDLPLAAVANDIPFVAPESRYGHAMVYDDTLERVVLFGGRDLEQFFDDTWEWDGATWKEKKIKGPPARMDYAMTYDPARESVVLNGGTDGTNFFADTWEYDGTFWSQVLTSDPGARRGHAMAYDPGEYGLLLYGGIDSNGEYLMDTWRFAWPEPVTVDLGASDPAWALGRTSQFVPPAATLGIGDLPGVSLKATNNVDTFGYWESLEYEIRNRATPGDLDNPLAGDRGRPVQRLTGPEEPDSVYLATYVLRSHVTDPAGVPQFRLRWNQSDLQQSTVLAVESRADGLLSPGAGGDVYTLPFNPPAGCNRFTLALDLLNFDPRDAADGDIQLDHIEMTTVSASRLANPSLVREYDFETGAEGWTTRNAPPFDPPAFQWRDGALTLSAPSGNANTFGYWQSPEADIQIDPAALYIVTFEVESNLAESERTRTPQFRVRVNEGGLHAGLFTAVESQGNAQRSPAAGAPQNYVLYFQPDATMAGRPLLLAFDLLNFDPEDKADAVLRLNRVKIETVPTVW